MILTRSGCYSPITAHEIFITATIRSILMAKDPRIDTGSRSRQLPPEAHIRMHFERFSSFVEEYSSKLSLSGMFVVTRDPRPVGSEVAFDLKLADGFRLFHGHGQVAWVRLEDGGRDAPIGMAVRFVALDEKGRELVLKVLEEQLKAGGLPFEIDPAPPGAVLDFIGLPVAQEANLGELAGLEPEFLGSEAPTGSGQLQIRLAPAFEAADFTDFAAPDFAAPDFAEEPTMVTARRRSLDETGFDAPWGQKLPEVPTDLLDESEERPSVPSVSEVVFASTPVPPALATVLPAGEVAVPGRQSGLFAAAFPNQSSRTESPEGLGFVLDENLPSVPTTMPEAPSSESSASAFPDFAVQDDVSWDLGQGADFAEEVDLGVAPGGLPFEPDPEDFNLDSEEPTLMGSAATGETTGEEPTLIGSRPSPLPAEGFFSVGPSAEIFEADAPAVPTFAPPSSPALQPSLFDSWESPIEPAPQVVAPPEIEAFTPFDLGSRTQPSQKASEPAEVAAPSYSSYSGYSGYTGQSEVPHAPEADRPYSEEEEGWQEEDYLHEAPSRGARIKEALRSRKAVLGLVATAVVVTAAYFLAGNLLEPGESAPTASRPKPGPRAQAPSRQPVGAGAENGSPREDLSAPEQIIAKPDSFADATQAEPQATTDQAAPQAADQTAFQTAPLPLQEEERPAGRGEPSTNRTEEGASRTEPSASRNEPVANRAEPARASNARWLVKIEVRKSAGQTLVEILFDGEMAPSLVAHNPMAYDRGKDQLTFAGIEGSRSSNREVGSPELTRIRMGQHPGELRVVFDHPAGIRISSISPDGNRLRVVFER